MYSAISILVICLLGLWPCFFSSNDFFSCTVGKKKKLFSQIPTKSASFFHDLSPLHFPSLFSQLHCTHTTSMGHSLYPVKPIRLSSLFSQSQYTHIVRNFFQSSSPFVHLLTPWKIWPLRWRYILGSWRIPSPSEWWRSFNILRTTNRANLTGIQIHASWELDHLSYWPRQFKKVSHYCWL